jgi:hypothetical protein
VNSQLIVSRDDSRAFPKQHHGAMRHAAVSILKRRTGNLRLDKNAIDLMAESFESSNNRLYGANGNVWLQLSHS